MARRRPDRGRSAAWIDAAIELLYNYDDGKDVSIDEALLEELTMAATTDGGIFLRDGTLAVNAH